MNDPELAALLQGLEDNDPVARLVALVQAADLAPDYPEVFAGASRDPDPGVRLEAVRALEGEGAAVAVHALVDRLDDTPDIARAAAVSLAEILDAAAGPVLVERLAGTKGGARAAVLAALRKLRPPAALLPALGALNDPVPQVRREAVGVLAYLRDERALSALSQRVAEDEDADVRRAAVGALAFAADDGVLPALLHALGDDDWQTREEAAVVLGKLRLPGAVDGLVRVLVSDATWQVRLKAAAALGGLRDHRALPALLGALEHPIPNLRKEAAAALGALGDAGAAAGLSALAADPDIEVRKAAARALQELRVTA